MSRNFALIVTVNSKYGYYRSFLVRRSMYSLYIDLLVLVRTFTVTHECITGMLKYTADVLRQLQRVDITVNRTVRKAIFSHELWCPRRIRNDVFGSKVIFVGVVASVLRYSDCTQPPFDVLQGCSKSCTGFGQHQTESRFSFSHCRLTQCTIPRQQVGRCLSDDFRQPV